MDFDRDVAARLGFPKTKCLAVERERRWLCRAVSRELIVQTHAIRDIYVSGTQLRLREARPVGGGSAMLRLTRKVDIDACTRLLTSIYLAEGEFALLASVLEGARLKKWRHMLAPYAGIEMSVDEFQDDLAGLILAEAEFETEEAMRTFEPPPFVVREVTDDRRFSGAVLATQGCPDA